MTNLQQFTLQNKIPAGIIEGTEAFWHKEEKWIIHQGETMRFNESPIKLQNMIVDMFLRDSYSQSYLTRMGITAFSQAFDRWYRCIIGDLDETPDFISGKLQPDAYNKQCTDFECPHRGKFCSLTIGLKFYEVATIQALKGGFTLEQTASLLCISLPGLKSRIEKIREKLEVRNMASMMARAGEIGI